jgi:hypothetical protein
VDEDDGDGGGATLMDRIRLTKRRRKILTDLQYRRGTTAAVVAVTSSTARSGSVPPSDSGRRGTAHLELDAPGDDAEEEEDATILERKHRQAMREFVRGRLVSTAKADVLQGEEGEQGVAQPILSINDGDAAGKERSPTVGTDIEAILAATAAAKGESSTDPDRAEGTGEARISTTAPVEDASASSASVMLHGTGIVEVVLPVKSRAEQTAELVRAAESRVARRRGNRGPLPPRDGAEPPGRGSDAPAPLREPRRQDPHALPTRPTASSVLPSRFRTYQPPPLPPQQYPPVPPTASAADADSARRVVGPATDLRSEDHHGGGRHGSNEDHGDHDPSSSRPGFAAFVRGRHPPSSHHRPHHQQNPQPQHGARGTDGSGSRALSSSSRRNQTATDHAVFKKFVEHQHQLPNKKR